MIVDAMRKLFAILAIGLFVGVLGACEEQGSVEQAGEAVDDAAEAAGDAVEDAADAAGDAAEAAGDAAEEATSN